MSDTPLLGRDDAVPRRRWRWLLPTVVVAAVVLLGGSVAMRVAGRDEAAAPKAALDSYLDAVEANATTRAYRMLCDVEGKPTRSAFAEGTAAERQNFGGVVRHRLGDASKTAEGDVVVTYTVQYKQTYRWFSARMRLEDDEWKVCGFAEIPRPEVRLPAEQIPEPPVFDDTGDTATTG